MQLAVLFAFCLSLLPITGTLALPIAAGESGMSSSRFPLDRGELKNLTPSSGKKYLPVMPDSKLESRDFLRQDEV
ncbi:hypothetical protein FRC02_010397 [Tulasnella sp. 418]|nr:hypothetical protein FRC02_010397 [Tulasnella sp. 418]